MHFPFAALAITYDEACLGLDLLASQAELLLDGIPAGADSETEAFAAYCRGLLTSLSCSLPAGLAQAIADDQAAENEMEARADAQRL